MEHDRKLERLVTQLRNVDPSRPVSLRKKAVSHMVPKRNDLRRRDQKIDVSDFNEIISIDRERRICVAEPGVTFVDLVEATLKHGLVPTVVPELKTITIGGAVAGCSLESMSFARGGFHDSCLEYEVVTANGEVLRCTPDNEHKLVFEMTHGSFGTLGVLTKLVFELVPAKPFVRVFYHRHKELASYQAEIRAHVDQRDIDFMDGIIHSPELHALSLAEFVDDAPYTNKYDWFKVYYRTTATRNEDFMRTQDYFFRYDNGVTNPTPRSAIARLLFGKVLHSANLLRIAEKFPFLLPEKSPGVTLDVFIPFDRMAEFLHWHERDLGLFPLWCVPYRVPKRYAWGADRWWDGVQGDLFVDLAMYGFDQPKGRNLYKEIEDELQRVNGVKTLISYNYYDEETFWTIWNKPNFDAVKKITDPNNIFRDLWRKTCRASQGLSEDMKISA